MTCKEIKNQLSTLNTFQPPINKTGLWHARQREIYYINEFPLAKTQNRMLLCK